MSAAISLLFVVSPKSSSDSQVTKMEIHPPRQAAVSSGATYSPPVGLAIAKLSIDTLVKPVGLAADNSMDIDKNDTVNTAWYNLGPKPGEAGSAVIAGHYGWKEGRGSVFNNLHTLQKGDVISVTNEQGAIIHFIVRETRRYSFDADTTEVFRSNDGIAHLNLITCDGAWDQSRQTYKDRLVVFSDMQK